jgi:hypothetical protein
MPSSANSALLMQQTSNTQAIHTKSGPDTSYVTFYRIVLITSYHIISHHIISSRHHITSPHYTISHHILTHHITSHHITSHHITSPHYIISQYNVSNLSFPIQSNPRSAWRQDYLSPSMYPCRACLLAE